MTLYESIGSDCHEKSLFYLVSQQFFSQIVEQGTEYIDADVCFRWYKFLIIS